MMLHSERDPGQKHRGGASRSVSARLQARVFSGLYRWGSRGYEIVGHAAFGDDWAVWRAAVVPFVQADPVLDLGCGPAHLQSMLTGLGWRAIGVDRSSAMLARARERPTGRVLPLVQADAAHLPFVDNCFASVVSTYPAPFILEPGVAAEIARVLRPDGVVAVVVGGRVESWRWWQAPRRVALTLFYGTASPEPPGGELLADGRLTGRWLDVASPSGRCWVWLARRA